MKVEQFKWNDSEKWIPAVPGKLGGTAQLVLVFCGTGICHNSAIIDEVRTFYPEAQIIGCSTAGEIAGTQVLDDSLTLTAIHFNYTRIRCAKTTISSTSESYAAGEMLARKLAGEDLVHVFALSDGLKINGSELVKGLVSTLPEKVSVTGGLSADGDRFQQTYVFWNDKPAQDQIVAIGLYGTKLKVGYGSFGGWDSFGPERLITRSQGNILYEFDGRSALALYKQYLGDHAKNLPASGLLFPIQIRMPDREDGLVRTILAVDEGDQSMTFAGDVPEGAYARLMKANFDRLIDGAVDAAKESHRMLGETPADLAILISCVGRKLILKQRVEEEVEGVQDILGKQAILTGFYSYGEISPVFGTGKCELHNQTMTITTFSERAS
ncbi:MAG: FIST C-terminal domain-containing protein [Syntrophaceae bacterium]|nr:FIST C-terminal domain-containing protein [Syntrophaceae bacterium]